MAKGRDMPGVMNIEQAENFLRNKDGKFWSKRGEQMMLRLFREMAARVPAYKKFLAEHGIRPARIRSFDDLRVVPAIDKKNYLRKYPLHELCWDGILSGGQYDISATSGSTGEPFYFPRTFLQDQQYALLAEIYLRTNFSIHKRRTLYINAFPMGIWIGGVFTHSAIRLVASRGTYPLSIINPGIHKQEVIKAVKKFSGEFDQILIGGYGPFVRDIINDGSEAGIDWKKLKLGFIFSAEGFSEEFRDHIASKTGIDPVMSTLNHYGTVDLGTMSYETPAAIAIRRIARSYPGLFARLFGSSGKLPTLTQFIPEMFFFEEVDGGLLCSGWSGLPLFRYDLKDNGNVFTYDRLVAICTEEGIDIEKEMKKLGVTKRMIWHLPFVQVFERADLSVSFYAFQVYPEMIRRALEGVTDHGITGKFSMRSDLAGDGVPVLRVYVELRPGVVATKELTALVESAIVKQLLEESSEYRETYKEKRERMHPAVTFHSYEDKEYFRPGGKQKWVIKEPT